MNMTLQSNTFFARVYLWRQRTASRSRKYSLRQRYIRQSA
jgi:hypothetical protein